MFGTIAVALLTLGFAQPPALDDLDFNRDIQPILQRHCYNCHGPAKHKGGLRLDRRSDAFTGGDSGPMFQPGHAEESLLIEKVSAEDLAERMPPEGPGLSTDEVQRLRTWIDTGATWPESTASATTEEPSHWSLKTPKRPELPAVANPAWAYQPLDRFILARLDREGVQPSPEADRRTLIRRLSLDLLGLPPTPEEITRFVEDPSPLAYEALVDRLLASPRFGELWARHWLDLARYADSDGYEKDSPRPNAYRYRDWVIDAINADMPFDQFTIEQLAGDLLPNASNEQKIATGFHRNTLTNREGGADQEEFRVAAVIDRTNTTGVVWLGLTVGCAQCHSHKYDPITQREYYSLFAFFNNGQEVELPVPTPAEQAAYLNELARFDAREIDKLPAPPAARAAILTEHEPKRSTRILARGDFLRPGDEVSAGTPAALPPLGAGEGTASRLDLARWLVSGAHPLTARVEVNRTWSYLFGRPLVATLDDFGARGLPPTHPDLLDWLATELVRLRWSRKALVRTIVTSAAYRQSSAFRPELHDRDPANDWVARQNRFRPEAEVMRDAFLAVSGLLAERVGGPSVRPPQPAGISELTYANSAKWVESTGPDRYRRGLYTWFQRTSPYPTLTTFDAPDGIVCTPRRERSNTPLQSLTLLNDTVFVECARGLARRTIQEAEGTDSDRLRWIFTMALGRSLEDNEREVLTALLEGFRQEARSDPRAAAQLAGDLAQPESDPVEPAVWTAMARTILNLDEFLVRE